MSTRAQEAITEWKAAYKLCNSREYSGIVWHKAGWISIVNNGLVNKYRVSEIEEMTRWLIARANHQESKE